MRTAMFVATALVMLGNYYVYDSIGPLADLLQRQLGFSDLQIGSLNAVYSLPNIFLVLVGGVLVDRYGTRAVMLATAAICFVGALITALGSHFPLMVAGRLVFGLGAETLLVSVLVALSRWFLDRYLALFLALNVSLARAGSYLADRSPSFADSLYQAGWQPPLWLAAAFAGLSLAGALWYAVLDRREEARGALAQAAPSERIDWRNLLRFRASYWYLVGLCVAFYSVIFPFRSTFAIKYFQQTRDLTLDAASRMNSFVFLTAVFATPVFGYLIDRFGRHAALMVAGSLMLPLSFLLFADVQIDLWIPTALLGVSFSLIPAVLWPAVALYVTPEQRGTAYGLMAMLQNAGLMFANIIAGYLNDRAGATASFAEGYAPMLWFFGLLGLVGFLFAMVLAWSARQAQPIHR